jgi:signal transduction histidine kinase
LVLQHRAGSVGAAVRAIRGRNLFVSFGVLLLLAVSMAMIIVSTQRANRLAKLQMDFVAGVSHELRTPVTVICSAADNLADGVVDGKEQVRQYGTLIGNEGRRLAEMVQQILLFASGRAGATRYELRPVHVPDVIHRALEGSASMIEAAGCRVERRIELNLPPVMADATALTQCVGNLISNALKYGGEARWMGIRSEKRETVEGLEVQVTVEDRGLGIDAPDLDHIFEPLYRARSVTAAQIHGTGLGLSLAKSIAEGMGGRLSVKSSPGGGSSFTLLLPALTQGDQSLKERATFSQL